MPEDDDIELETIKKELAKNPRVTVYEGLIQAAED
jgi:hypothetical protein